MDQVTALIIGIKKDTYLGRGISRIYLNKLTAAGMDLQQKARQKVKLHFSIALVVQILL